MSARIYERATVSDCGHEGLCQGNSSLRRGVRSQAGRNLKTSLHSARATSQQVPSPRHRVYCHAFFPKNANPNCQPKEQNLVLTTRQLGRSSSGSSYQGWAVDWKVLTGWALKKKKDKSRRLTEIFRTWASCWSCMRKNGNWSSSLPTLMPQKLPDIRIGHSKNYLAWMKHGIHGCMPSSFSNLTPLRGNLFPQRTRTKMASSPVQGPTLK